MEKKRFRFSVKEVSDAGEFSGYASVFDNIDLGGDIIERGAFKRTLENQKGKIIILNGHDTRAEIGMTTLAKEDSHGLFFKGQLYLDSADPLNEIPDARMAYVRMKRRLEHDKPLGMSIGYDIVQKEMDGVVRRLKELKLYEISPVTFAMNPLAEIASVKAWSDSMTTTIEATITECKKFIESQTSKILKDQMEKSIVQFEALLESIRKSDSGQAHSEPEPILEPAGKTDDTGFDSFVKVMQEIRAEVLVFSR